MAGKLPPEAKPLYFKYNDVCYRHTMRSIKAYNRKNKIYNSGELIHYKCFVSTCIKYDKMDILQNYTIYLLSNITKMPIRYYRNVLPFWCAMALTARRHILSKKENKERPDIKAVITAFETGDSFYGW